MIPRTDYDRERAFSRAQAAYDAMEDPRCEDPEIGEDTDFCEVCQQDKAPGTKIPADHDGCDGFEYSLTCPNCGCGLCEACFDQTREDDLCADCKEEQ